MSLSCCPARHEEGAPKRRDECMESGDPVGRGGRWPDVGGRAGRPAGNECGEDQRPPIRGAAEASGQAAWPVGEHRDKTGAPGGVPARCTTGPG